MIFWFQLPSSLGCGRESSASELRLQAWADPPVFQGGAVLILEAHLSLLMSSRRALRKHGRWAWSPPNRHTGAHITLPGGWGCPLHSEALVEAQQGCGRLAAKGGHGDSLLFKAPDPTALSLTTLFLWIVAKDAKPRPLPQETHLEISRFSLDSVFQALGNGYPIPGQGTLGSSILHNLYLCLFLTREKK